MGPRDVPEQTSKNRFIRDPAFRERERIGTGPGGNGVSRTRGCEEPGRSTVRKHASFTSSFHAWWKGRQSHASPARPLTQIPARTFPTGGSSTVFHRQSRHHRQAFSGLDAQQPAPSQGRSLHRGGIQGPILNSPALSAGFDSAYVSGTVQLRSPRSKPARRFCFCIDPTF